MLKAIKKWWWNNVQLRLERLKHKKSPAPAENDDYSSTKAYRTATTKPQPKKDEEMASYIPVMPEVLEGEKGRGWQLQNGPFGVNQDDKVIQAPMDGSGVSHCLRMQALGTAKWDDSSLSNSEHLLFMAMERHRINFLLKSADVDISEGMINPDSWGSLQMMMTGSKTGMLSGLLLMDYSSVYKDSVETITSGRSPGDELVEDFNFIRQEIQANPTKMKTVELYKKLLGRYEWTNVPNFLNGKKPGRDQKAMTFEEAFEGEFNGLEEDDSMQKLPENIRRFLKENDSTDKRMTWAKASYGGRKGLVPWGRMDVEEPARSWDALGRFHKKWKATDEGSYPRFPHRYTIDQKVFAVRTKVPGGTVVIDGSGSMALSPAQIEQIVRCAPGCQVAIYSGTTDHGKLRILAKDGRRCAESLCRSPSGNGNIVDYPALRWGLRMLPPRIWVSDCCVTGVNDAGGAENLAKCLAVAKKGRYHICANVDEATQFLRRIGKFYKK